MKKTLPAALCATLLALLCGCAGPAATPDPAGAPSSAGDGAAGEALMCQAFPGAARLEVTGLLQHIVVTAADGDALVLRWHSDGTETVTQEDGRVALTFPEPDWMDGAPHSGSTPRFTVVSTIYVELPAALEALVLTTTLGDITLEGAAGCTSLAAATVNGDICAAGLTGRVRATSLEGTIGLEALAAYITEQPYDTTRTSKHLDTTLPGGGPAQEATLHTVLGSITLGG